MSVSIQPPRCGPRRGRRPTVHRDAHAWRQRHDGGNGSLETPRGWPAIPPQQFRLTQENEREDFTFQVRAPASLPPAPSAHRRGREADGRRYDVGVVTVDYPHIHPRSYLRPAGAVVQPAALLLPPVREVGYVRGASDRVPEALRGVGVPITLLDDRTLDRGDLSRFDAIVVGPRAYETDSALVESNGRLLEYARRGGLVIVQYQQEPILQRRIRAVSDDRGRTSLTPGVPVRHDRVTDEKAPVAVLTPADPDRAHAQPDRGRGLERLGSGARASTSREAGTRRIGRSSRRTTRVSSRSGADSSSPAWARGHTCTPD